MQIYWGPIAGLYLGLTSSSIYWAGMALKGKGSTYLAFFSFFFSARLKASSDSLAFFSALSLASELLSSASASASLSLSMFWSLNMLPLSSSPSSPLIFSLESKSADGSDTERIDTRISLWHWSSCLTAGVLLVSFWPFKIEILFQQFYLAAYYTKTWASSHSQRQHSVGIIMHQKHQWANSLTYWVPWTSWSEVHSLSLYLHWRKSFVPLCYQFRIFGLFILIQIFHHFTQCFLVSCNICLSAQIGIGELLAYFLNLSLFDEADYLLQAPMLSVVHFVLVSPLPAIVIKPVFHSLNGILVDMLK